MSSAADPVPQELAALLRCAVLGLMATERRRVFPPTIHLGRPGGSVASFAEDDQPRWGSRAGQGLDAALRTEIVAALLTRVGEDPPPLAWLTRTGPLAAHDLDAQWLPAVLSAYAEAGVPATMVVVTRRGWFDPRSGQSRQWRRLRAR